MLCARCFYEPKLKIYYTPRINYDDGMAKTLSYAKYLNYLKKIKGFFLSFSFGHSF